MSPPPSFAKKGRITPLFLPALLTPSQTNLVTRPRIPRPGPEAAPDRLSGGLGVERVGPGLPQQRPLRLAAPVGALRGGGDILVGVFLTTPGGQEKNKQINSDKKMTTTMCRFWLPQRLIFVRKSFATNTLVNPPKYKSGVGLYIWGGGSQKYLWERGGGEGVTSGLRWEGGRRVTSARGRATRSSAMLPRELTARGGGPHGGKVVAFARYQPKPFSQIQEPSHNKRPPYQLIFPTWRLRFWRKNNSPPPFSGGKNIPDKKYNRIPPQKNNPSSGSGIFDVIKHRGRYIRALAYIEAYFPPLHIPPPSNSRRTFLFPFF